MIFVMTISSGSPMTIGQLAATGLPRVFDGDAIYVYNTSSALWTTRDFGGTWINVIPLNFGMASTICQTSGSSTSGEIGISDITYTTGAGVGPILTKYQNFPENTVWNAGAPIPSGNLSDSVSSVSSDFPILIGNIRSANAARVWRTTFVPPYSAVKSDSGLPITAQITDLDIAE